MVAGREHGQHGGTDRAQSEWRLDAKKVFIAALRTEV
jgi:hypothetical protein